MKSTGLRIMCIVRLAGGGTPHSVTVRGLFATYGSGVEQDAGGVEQDAGNSNGKGMSLFFVTAASSGICCVELMPLQF